jgi:hypothetical protein
MFYNQAILVQWLKEWDGRPARLSVSSDTGIRYGGRPCHSVPHPKNSFYLPLAGTRNRIIDFLNSPSLRPRSRISEAGLRLMSGTLGRRRPSVQSVVNAVSQLVVGKIGNSAMISREAAFEDSWLKPSAKPPFCPFWCAEFVPLSLTASSELKLSLKGLRRIFNRYSTCAILKSGQCPIRKATTLYDSGRI